MGISEIYDIRNILIKLHFISILVATFGKVFKYLW